MGKIIQLREEVIEQIAAGEVVESPASIVKELIENSLDAGANKIFIEIEDGGKTLIRVTDDGYGMTKEDAKLSVKRHATSKIENISDLFDIKTLGFRGEALAAISSVSQFELVTKTDYAMEGTRVRFEDNEPIIETVASPKGTTIVVKNIFYNTPARKKHLRTNSFEFSKISQIVTKYAISNPLVYFKLTHNSKIVLSSPNTASLYNNIVDIYGTDVAKQLLKVDYEDKGYKIHGYISKPSFSRSDKDLINIYVNNRYVKNKTMIDAVFDSYHTLLHSQRYPFSLLKINIDPKQLDVNIHPSKTKIKIEQEGKLYELIFDVIRQTLKNNDIISQTVKDNEKQELLDKKSAEELNEKNTNQFPKRKYSVSSDSQEQLSVNEELNKENDNYQNNNPSILRDKETTPIKQTYSYDSQDDKVKAATAKIMAGPELSNNNDNIIKEHTKVPTSNIDDTSKEKKEQEPKIIDTSKRPKLKILGQIYKTYILLETKNGLSVMDQHAAHERVLFEQLIKDSRNMTFGKQELLSPVKIDLTVRETSVIEENKSFFKQAGFEVENFGGGSYLIRTVPVVLSKNQDKEFLQDLISDFVSHGKVNTLDKMKKEVFSTMACKAAIKAGEELTPEQMKNLVKDFFSLDLSYTCPHGRPIVIEISIEELEKRFKRTGF